MGRVVIIGLDGVPFGMLQGFADSGVMPNVSKVIEGGVFRQMRSSVPEISSVAWSSIITGAGPGRHGIFGFIDMHPGTYQMRFPNFNDLKVQPFWCDSDGRSVIMNVPSTYPVKEMNGVHISGFVSIDFEKSIHPKSLVPKLRDLDYQLDVDAQLAQSSMEKFLEDLDKSLETRIEACRCLWDSEDWENYMLVFTGTDRLMHFLWSAYEDAEHEHHDFFLEHFRKIDAAVGEICSKLADDDIVMILSDHGFERLDTEVYINRLLMDEGFLSFKPGCDPGLGNICPKTRAFALDPARIYVNRKTKYPEGRVEEGDIESCLQDLEQLFASLEIGGRKVIKHIYRKEEIYGGPYLDEASELILIAEKGFNLKGSMASPTLTGKGPFTGKHTYEDAFVIVSSKEAADSLPEKPSVIDAGKLIKKLV